MSMNTDTYTKPPHGWTCFFCGETFTTPGGAATHFGVEQSAKPGCLIKVQLGGERGLLMALRKAEEEIARHMAEDTDLHRQLFTTQSRHSDQLNYAEETGYARGLRDAFMNWNPISTAPQNEEVFIGKWVTETEWRYEKATLVFEKQGTDASEPPSGWVWSVQDLELQHPTHWSPALKAPWLKPTKGAT